MDIMQPFVEYVKNMSPLDTFMFSFFFIVPLCVVFSGGKMGHLPLGPSGLPMFGSYLSLFFATKLYQKLRKISSLYGNVACISLFRSFIITINSYQVFVAFFEQENSYKRAKSFLLNSFSKGKGLSQNNGLYWATYKRLLLKSIRDEGIVNNLKERMRVEVNAISKEAYENPSLPIRELLHKACLNAMTTLLFGSTLADEKEAKQLLSRFKRINREMRGLRGVYFPWFQRVTFGFFNFVVNRNACFVLLSKLFDDKRKEKRTERNCFFDYFREEKESKEGAEEKVLTDENMRGVCLEILFLGTEKLTLSLVWALHFMAKHPEVQRNLGTMYPMDAVLTEVLRKSSLMPLGFLYSTTKNVTLDGFSVPKGSLILPNYYALLRENKNSFSFDPLENMMGNQRKVAFNVVGGRSCPGEQLTDTLLAYSLDLLLDKFWFQFSGEMGENAADAGGHGFFLDVSSSPQMIVSPKYSNQL